VKERVRVVRPRLEFRVELRTDEERVIRKFDDLDELLVRLDSGQDHPCIFEVFAVFGVELVVVPVACIDVFFGV